MIDQKHSKTPSKVPRDPRAIAIQLPYTDDEPVDPKALADSLAENEFMEDYYQEKNDDS